MAIGLKRDQAPSLLRFMGQLLLVRLCSAPPEPRVRVSSVLNRLVPFNMDLHIRVHSGVSGFACWGLFPWTPPRIQASLEAAAPVFGGSAGSRQLRHSAPGALLSIRMSPDVLQHTAVQRAHA